MIKIRLTRTGKTSQESFRIVVANHHKAVKKQFIEVLGHYAPAKEGKPAVLNKERAEYWLKTGARPTDTVASILKKNGFSNMDKFIKIRTKQTAKKNASPKS